MDSISLSGQTVLHYRVIEKIGEGGMGVVYKAQDTHLDRFVALKVLPREKMADIDRRQRFVQEAKAASSLHHPNIVVVHDIAADVGLDFIVMEYIEGKTLDVLIGRKGLELKEALGYAIQIADGLARAHAAGIIHRDLKPGNIMVTPDGQVKILDFGLAKLAEDAPAADTDSTATLGRPDRPKTAEGHILGTVTYMSPEQAEGKKLDARSDIFSFGSVLYEMLTGRPAFRRDSQVATLAAILSEEPKPAATANESLPAEVSQLLARCLRKDPQRRWQTMSDLKVLLQDLKEDSESGKLQRPPFAIGRRRRSPFAWLGLAAALLAAGVLLWLFLPKTTRPADYTVTRLTFDEGMSWSPTVSPDGMMLAYASDRDSKGDLNIWVQRLAGGPPLQLTTHPAEDGWPSFSPDGAKIVFRSERDGGGLYEVAALGGGEHRISDRGFMPRYSPDGAWISAVEIPATYEARLTKMVLLPARGGTPVPFQPDFCLIGLAVSSAPVWSPDGKFLLFNGRKIDDLSSLDWWVAPVSGGPAIRTNAHKNLPLYPNWRSPYAWTDSHVYYATGSTVEGVNIFRAHIDKESLEIRGPIERITSGPGMQHQASVLPDGRLVYSNIEWLAKIWTLKGRPDLGLISGDPVPITQDITAKFNPGLSRDGSKLIYSVFGGIARPLLEVRLKDLAGGGEKIIPMSAAQLGQMPVISPDGTVFAYRDTRENTFRTFLSTATDGSIREVCDSCRILGFYSDPRFALIREQDRLFRLNIPTGEKTLVLETLAGRISDPALSPDDRWIAFVLGKPDGRAALLVAPISGHPVPEKDWVLLCDENRYLGSPAWSPNGEWLYYLSERNGPCCAWAQKLEPASKKPIGNSQVVYRPPQTRLMMNYPPGNGSIAVGKDKIVLWMADTTGNIYLASPGKK